MRKQLFEKCGITHLDINVLLYAKENDEYKDWRSFVLTELGNFVAGTRLFTTQQ